MSYISHTPTTHEEQISLIFYFIECTHLTPQCTAKMRVQPVGVKLILATGWKMAPAL